MKKTLKYFFILTFIFILSACTKQSTYKVSDITTDTSVNYAFNKYSEEDKEIYANMYMAFKNFDESFIIENTDEGRINSIFLNVLYDHPEIFYIETIYSVFYRNYAKITVEYNTEKEEAKRQLEEINKIISSEKFKHEDDYYTIKNIYDYITSIAQYSEGSEYDQDMRSAFLDKKSVCGGFASAMQYLLQMNGIESYKMIGKVSTTNTGLHGWLLVKCNDKYYYCDPTWGAIEKNEYEENNKMYYQYMLYNCDDSYFNYTINDTGIELNECTSIDDSYFVRDSFYIKSDFNEDIFRDIGKYLSTEKHVTIKCDSVDTFDNFLKQFNETDVIYETLPKDIKNVYKKKVRIYKMLYVYTKD